MKVPGCHQHPVLLCLVAGCIPKWQLLRGEQGQRIVLSLPPERPLRTIEREQRRETKQIAKASPPHPAIEAGVCDALSSNGSRRLGDFLADRLRQVEVPPLGQIERADDNANAPARRSDPHHFSNRAISVAFLKYRDGKDHAEVAVGKRQGLGAARQKMNLPGEAFLGRQSFGLLEVERVHIDRGNPISAAETLRKQPVERAGAAPYVEDSLIRYWCDDVDQIAKHRLVGRHTSAVFERGNAAKMATAQCDDGEMA